MLYLKSLPIWSCQLRATSIPVFFTVPAFFHIVENPDVASMGTSTSKSLVFFEYQSNVKPNLPPMKRASTPMFICSEVSHVSSSLGRRLEYAPASPSPLSLPNEYFPKFPYVNVPIHWKFPTVAALPFCPQPARIFKKSSHDEVFSINFSLLTTHPAENEGK